MSFNAKLVQLKDKLFLLFYCNFVCFNAKMVQLKELTTTLLFCNMNSFNAKMVQLKVYDCSKQAKSELVSMPKWYN